MTLAAKPLAGPRPICGVVVALNTKPTHGGAPGVTACAEIVAVFKPVVLISASTLAEANFTPLAS